MKLDGKIAFVTGASSGIGEAIARALRAEGATVYAAARRRERLQKIADETGCIPYELDVRDRVAVLKASHDIPIDILINNAGLGRALGALWDAELADIEMTVDTNLTSVLHLTSAVVPGMIQRGRGHIVNMSSVVALYPLKASLYSATKGAVHKLSQDLRMELQGTGIRVTEINPGRVESEFYQVAIDDTAKARTAVETGTVALMADDIAEAVIYCVTAPWRVNVSMMEILPTEQTYGGSDFIPFPGAGQQ